MLFNRRVAKLDAILGGFLACALAIFSFVVSIVTYVQGEANSFLLSDLLLDFLVLADGLAMAVAWLRNDKKTAFIAAAVGMPLFESAIFFGNVDVYMKINDLYDTSFAAWLGFIWYMVAAAGLIETTFYLVAGLVKGKSNPKFSVSENTEVNSFFLSGAGVCFAIAGGLAESWSYWGSSPRSFRRFRWLRLLPRRSSFIRMIPKKKPHLLRRIDVFRFSWFVDASLIFRSRGSL